jgi:hypothetical protein
MVTVKNRASIVKKPPKQSLRRQPSSKPYDRSGRNAYDGKLAQQKAWL